MGSGGFLGEGFGQGRQQFGFVPLGYNDFIAQHGRRGVGIPRHGAIWSDCSRRYAWLGIRIAQQARTPFLQLVAVGLTVTTVVTAFLHIGVVIGLLPTTGLTLPFVSYGRSNLLLSFLMTGILVNIGSRRERVVGAGATNPLSAPGLGAGGLHRRRHRRTPLSGAGDRARPGAIVRTSSRFSSAHARGIERDVLPGTEFPHLLLDLHPLYRGAPWKQLADRSRAVSSGQ